MQKLFGNYHSIWEKQSDIMIIKQAITSNSLNINQNKNDILPMHVITEEELKGNEEEKEMNSKTNHVDNSSQISSRFNH